MINLKSCCREESEFQEKESHPATHHGRENRLFKSLKVGLKSGASGQREGRGNHNMALWPRKKLGANSGKETTEAGG